MKSPAQAAPAFRGNLKIRAYTDEDLRHLELETDRPLALGNFSDSPPRVDEALVFVSQYVSDDDLICAFGHHHKGGFVLESEDDGRRHLIGCDCARTRYGIQWDTFVSDVEHQIKRKKMLAWLHKVSGSIKEMETDIIAAIDHPAVKAFDALRRDLRKLPDFMYERCRWAAQSPDSWLRGRFPWRDLQAERLRKERARTRHSELLRREEKASSRELREAARELKEAEEPYIKYEMRPVLRVPCRTLFTHNGKMRPRLDPLARNIVGMGQTLTSAQAASHPDLAAQALIARAKEFDEIVSEIDDAIAMFSRETLELFCTWLRSDSFGPMTVNQLSDGFSVGTGHATVTIVRPANLNPLPLRLAGRFHR